MSGRMIVVRVAVVAGALLVWLIGFAVPAAGQAVPLPQATSSASKSSTPSKSSTTATANPSPSKSKKKVDPAEPTDDGTDPAPDQSGTWIAIGSAAALSVLAGLVIVLRKR